MNTVLIMLGVGRDNIATRYVVRLMLLVVMLLTASVAMLKMNLP